jgi:hypothetical protein
MIRRVGILILLLVSLFGATAGAFACALAAGSADCCAPDGSCRPNTSQIAILSSYSADCCSIGSAAQAAWVAVVAKAQTADTDKSSPDTSSVTLTASSPFVVNDDGSTWPATDSSLPYQDRQQTYLLTGRLRL